MICKLWFNGVDVIIFGLIAFAIVCGLMYKLFTSIRDKINKRFKKETK